MTAIPKPFSRRGTAAADGDVVGVLPLVAWFRRRQSFLFLLGDGVDAVGFLFSELGVIELAFAGLSLLGVFSSSELLSAFAGVSFAGVRLLGVFSGDFSGTWTCQFF